MEKQYSIDSNGFSKDDYEFFVIVGDVGGSNSYFAVLGVKSKKDFDIIVKYSIETSKVGKVYEVMNTILGDVKLEYDIEVNRCCIGAAGPVSRRRGYIKLTNIDLEIRVQEIMDNTMLNKVILINDFEAIGYGIDLIDMEKDVVKIDHVGEDLTGGWTRENVYAVLGAGAGLGVSVVYYDNDTYLHAPLPSEGGHMDLIIHDKFDMEFAEYLKKNYLEKKDVHPEFERVLSGQGMELLYEFIRSKKKRNETVVSEKIKTLKGIPKLREIEKNYDKDPVCKETVEKLINYFGRAARIIALMSECYSGLFITGNVVMNNINLFKDGLFMKEFEKHDKRSDVLRKIPVYAIKNKDVSLYGCCNVATNFYNIV
ncbi:MAG: glucokinase [Candidatus Woesearchaeota archaeon]